MADDAATLDPVLTLLPVPAARFDGERLIFANPALHDLLPRAADLTGSGLRSGLHDDADRDRLDDLLAGGRDEAILRWGTQFPLVSLQAWARRLGPDTTLVVFVDDTETARLDALLTAFNNAAMVIDRERRARWMSRGLRDAYGEPYPLGSDSLTRVHPDDHDTVAGAFDDALASPRRKVRATGRVSHADFPDVWWKLDMVSMNLLDDPAVGGIASTFGPHAEQAGDRHDDAPEAMRLSDIMPVGIVQALVSGACYYRNRLATQHLGPIELGDGPDRWIDRARQEDREPLLRAMKDAAAGNRAEPVVAGFAAGGRSSWLRIEFSPQFTATGAPAGWVATSLDVTAETEARQELHAAQERLWHLANHDALTGLPNRPAIIDRIEAALARASRDAHGVALLFCDLDGFKPVNDAHGHEAGDLVLQAVAGRLRAAVRASDSVGRLGGDEFVVLCESFDTAHEIAEIEERIVATLARPIGVGSPARAVHIGVTIGSVTAEADDTSASLLARADAVMYENKKARADTDLT